MTDSKVSAFLSARPPDTTRCAVARSGRVDSVTVVRMCSVGGFGTWTDLISLISMSELSVSLNVAGVKDVPLTVQNLILSFPGARTVEMALPAYMGRVNVVEPVVGSCDRDVTSERVGRSIMAETRGRRDLAVEEVDERTCVNGEESRRDCRRGDKTSGNGCSYCGD
jgi:hypothetical protein